MTLPLEGIRVADFSWVVAGPYCTLGLALMGAEVIRLETAAHTDINRRLPPMAEEIEGLERSGLWHGLNVGKKSVTLNLREPEAQELAKEIISQCDVAIENFSFGQLEKFNLGYEELKAVKPDLVMVRSSGLGRTGPFKHYVTFGPPMTAYTGLASLTGQLATGRPERGIGGLWSDHQAGMTSVFGLLAALEHRDRTGEGQLVEYSMSEAVAGQLQDAFIEYACTGEVPGPIGNTDRSHHPYGMYPARGNDRWVAIAVQTDDEWERFVAAVPGPDWWKDPDLATAKGRRARMTELDEAISAWTSTMDEAEIVALLHEQDISAGAAATIEDLLEDPLLRERGFFLKQDHPEVGERELAGLDFGFRKRGEQVGHAPLLGEHNWEVFVEWLGMDPERFGELVSSEVIY